MFRLAVAICLAAFASAAQLRINCGGPALPAIGWLPDVVKYRSTPSYTYLSPVPVDAPGSWAPVYSTHAYGPTKLVYRFPVLAGPYVISLMFAETYYKAAGKRMLSVKIGNTVVTDNLDVFAAAGGANKRYFLSAGTHFIGRDQVLYIEVTAAGAGGPMLSGILIDGDRPDALIDGGSPPVTPPATPPVAPPVKPSPLCFGTVGKNKITGAFRMNVGGGFLSNGNYAAENTEYISKNSIIATNGGQSPAGGIFRSERYTRAAELTVRIPVPNGSYTVATVHAESFFMETGKRSFDILVNGQVRETKVDVVARAKGAKKAYEAVFSRVAAVDGAITITFRKRKGLENPFVNAVRVEGAGAGSIAVAGGCPSTGGPTPPPPQQPGQCRTAKKITGATAANSGFLMNVGGKAIAKIGFAADNVNYIPTKNKGETLVADTSVDVGTGTWGPVWASSRWTSLPALTYVIPAPKGDTKFRIALFLVESFFGKNGLRQFDIVINGKMMDAKVDIHKRVGKNKPLYLQYENIVAVDGKLTISLRKVTENPTLNAIYIQGAGIGSTAIGGFEDGTC